MTISLYYIRGITPLDEPNFSSKSVQETFFNNNKILDIEQTYYPPHYTNTIRFDVNDINFKSQINYLSLNYDDKIYYYFIQNIRYINEYVIELNIIMDTFQTYMFDIIYNNFTINRYSMKRWKKLSNGRIVINRDYERENFSLTDKHNIVFKRLETKPYLIIQARKLQDNTTNKPSNIYYGISDTNRKYIDFTDGCEYYLLPIPTTLNGEDIAYNIVYTQSQGSGVINTNKTIKDIISYLSESSYVLNIYYCNNPSFYSFFEYEISNNNITINVKNTGSKLLGVNINDIGLLYIENFNYYDKYEMFTGFKQGVRNTDLKNTFSLSYIPQLIDENYYELKFGEKLGYTSFPLHKILDINNMYCKYNYNITNGNRVYTINDIKDINISVDNNYEYIDKYLTSITNSTIQTIPTYNDAYERYLSTNKGTLTTGLALAKQSNLYQGVKNTMSSTLGLISSFATGNPTRIASGITGLGFSVSDTFFNDYKIDKQYQIQQENVEFTPDTTKSGNEYSSDVIGNAVDVMYSLSCVDDLESVALKMETLGYSYRIIKSNSDENYNLLVDNNLLPRWYYNVIKCENMNLSFRVLVSDEIKKDIINRFINGLRLWRTTNDGVSAEFLGNFKYDNIEIENIGN